MAKERSSGTLTRREAIGKMAKIAGGTAAGLAMAGGITPAAAQDKERQKLAREYRNAKPGEKFAVGHITFHLSQEYAMMVYQANEQACKQLGLKFMGAVYDSGSSCIEITESMIAKGAKALTYNVPPMAVMPEITRICNENNVFMASHFGYTGDVFPGDYGPRWVVDNTPLSDEQTFMPLILLMERMRQSGKTKILHHQASKTAATVSTVYINLGVYQAWKFYPEMKMLGHQYGEWNFEGGRKAGEASLASRTDYEGLWGANDSQTMGALRACEDRGLRIGPLTASRDMEMTTAEEILKGNFLLTSGFAIPYFGGRMVPMLYDMCTGAWYPKQDEMIQSGRIDCYGRPGELEELSEASRLSLHPSFAIGPTEENLQKVLKEMKSRKPKYPYDFRLLSLGKCKELGLTYDRNAGGGTHLAPNSHDYYFPAKLKKFGSLTAIRKHVGALHKYFLDFNVDTWEEAERYAKQFPPELKTEPNWL